MLNDVARSVMVSQASSNTVTPNFWPDPQMGTLYPVAVQTPQYQVNTVDDLGKLVVAGNTSQVAAIPTLLRNVATIERTVAPDVISHSNIQPVLDIDASAEDRSVA